MITIDIKTEYGSFSIKSENIGVYEYCVDGVIATAENDKLKSALFMSFMIRNIANKCIINLEETLNLKDK